MDRYTTLLPTFCCVEPNYIPVANYKSDLEMVSFGIQEDEQNMDSWKHQTQTLSKGIMNLCTSSVYITWEGPPHLRTLWGVCVCVCVRAHAHPPLFSYVQPFVMPWTVAPLGSSIHGIFQANMLEQVAISFSRESSWSRDQTCISWVSWVGKWIFFITVPPGKPLHKT